MGWGNITGEESMGALSGNEIILESGKPKKVVLRLADGEEPYSFFQHTFEVEKVENGQVTKVFRTVNCPKTKKNPHAPCPLCDGQQAPRRIRHAARAFEIESGAERYLAGGEQIWTPIATSVKLGIKVNEVVWGIMKQGSGRNDTSYSATNLGPITMPLPECTLPATDIQYAPHTVDEMRSIAEGLGLNWATLIVPPPVQYQGSLQEALDHVVPNTKYKGQTMKQIWDTNQGMIEFFANSNRVSPEKAAAQIILVALKGAVIPGVPNYANGGSVTPPAQNIPSTPAPAQAPPAQTPPAQTSGVNKQAMINEINSLLSTKERFIKGGYDAIISAMKEASNGKTAIVEFTDAELAKMLEICRA